MSIMYSIVYFISIVAILYISFAAVVAIITVLHNRSEAYREKYKSFVDQEKRIQERLERNEN
jgi:formiminotetrahydrofolate cyclodeaminase